MSKSDDSVEHLLELGYLRMTNLLANELYKEVVVPTEIQSNMPVARKVRITPKILHFECLILSKIELDKCIILFLESCANILSRESTSGWNFGEGTFRNQRSSVYYRLEF